MEFNHNFKKLNIYNILTLKKLKKFFFKYINPDPVSTRNHIRPNYMDLQLWAAVVQEAVLRCLSIRENIYIYIYYIFSLLSIDSQHFLSSRTWREISPYPVFFFFSSPLITAPRTTLIFPSKPLFFLQL